MADLATLPFGNLFFLPPKGSKGRGLALALLALSPFFFGALALYMGQDANWDLRNYHWYNAYAFWNGRYTFDLLPSQTPFFYNPTLDIPFYLLATHVSAKTAGFILGAVQGINFILLFMLAHALLLVPAKPHHKVLVSAFLAALGMLGGGGIAQIGTTFYDNITSLGILASAFIVIINLNHLYTGRTKDVVRLAFFAGIPAGLMMGLKLPSVVFCVGLCGALLFVTGSVQRRLALAFAFGFGILAGLCVTMGHWMVFLKTHFDSPLFPYFNNFFASPLAPLTSARDVQFLPQGFFEKLFYPFIFSRHPTRVGEIPWQDYRLVILYVLLPLALLLRFFFGRNPRAMDQIARPYESRYLLWMMAISYFVWLSMFAIYRYAIPMEMLAPLLIVVAAGFLPVKLNIRAMIAAILLIAIAITVQGGNWSRRATWSEKFIEVTLPSLVQEKPDAMLLMAGFEPYAHLVPSFPKEMPVLRLQSNFASPEQDKGINTVVKQRVAEHKGSFLLLIPPAGYQHDMAEAALKVVGLTHEPQICQKVLDHLLEGSLDLCEVRRAQ